MLLAVLCGGAAIALLGFPGLLGSDPLALAMRVFLGALLVLVALLLTVHYYTVSRPQAAVAFSREPAATQLGFVEWTGPDGVEMRLEPTGVFRDGEALAGQGLASLHLELQTHEATADQLWLLAAVTHPEIRVVWQGPLPRGLEGERVARELLRDSRVRDERRAIRGAPVVSKDP